jgi:ComF family protein
MVRAIKYRGDGRFVSFFAEELFVRAELGVRLDAVVPVPLHRLREWHRKFNQAALLADEYSKISGISVWRGLLKHKRTPAQSSLSNLGRKKNLRGAFLCKAGVPVPRRILLVDDVITTGSTIAECARVLRQAGAKKVYALSVARVLKQF